MEEIVPQAPSELENHFETGEVSWKKIRTKVIFHVSQIKGTIVECLSGHRSKHCHIYK